MTDELVHALAFDDNVRILTLTSTELVRDAARIHDTGPTATAALGRLLSGTLMMAATQKDLTRLTVHIQGNGPAGRMLARSAADGSVYGTIADPHAECEFDADGRVQVGGIVGDRGMVQVVRDLGFGEPYVGTTELQTGEIGDDLAHYLMSSEQVQSAFGVGVKLSPDGVVSAGGFLIQLLGGLTEDQTRLLSERLGALSILSSHIEAGATARDLLTSIAPDVRVLETRQPRYFCPHDKEYYRVRLLSLGKSTVDDLFGHDDHIEVRCEFTRNVYHFQRSEIRYDS